MSWPGRLGVAMYGLSIVMMSVSALGGYTKGGLVGGTFAASEAIFGPLVGRQIDRHGQHALLPWAAAAHLLAASGLVISVGAVRSLGAALPAAMAAGASVPQFGALAAARWSHLLHGEDRIRTALSLESLANDVAFITGPAAAGMLAALWSPAAGLVAAGALVVTSGVALSALRATEPAAGRGGTPAGPRVPRDVRFLITAVCALNLLLGLTFGTMQLTVTALARATGSAGYSGLFYLTMTLGSLAASVVYGLAPGTMRVARRLAMSSVVFLVGAAGFTANLGLAGQVGGLFLIGTGIGPAVIASGILIERYVPQAFLTRAFTLAAVLSAGGIALAGALAGRVVNGYGHAGGGVLVIAYGLAMLAAAGLIGRATVVLSADHPRVRGPAEGRADGKP